MTTILHSKPRDMFPGDTMRILTRDATSADGRYFYAGTKFQPGAIGHDNVRGSDYQDIRVIGQDRDTRFLAWHYALVDGVTPNRATVVKLLDGEQEAIAERAEYGRSDVAAVRSLRPLATGERIWIGAQARGVEVL